MNNSSSILDSDAPFYLTDGRLEAGSENHQEKTTQNRATQTMLASTDAETSIEKVANIINDRVHSAMTSVGQRARLFNVVSTLPPAGRKRFKTNSVAALLILAFSTNSYAQGNDHGSTMNALKPVTDIATITSDYFDANWELFTDLGAPQSSADDDVTSIADKYLDANWSMSNEFSTPGKTSAEASIDGSGYSKGVSPITTPR